MTNKKSPLVNLTHSFTYNLNFPGVVDCKRLLLPKYGSAFPPLESEPTYVLVHKQKLDIVSQSIPFAQSTLPKPAPFLLFNYILYKYIRFHVCTNN